MTERPDRRIDAARLTALLAKAEPGVLVERVDRLGESSGSANRLRLGVHYAPGRDAGLPDTMFLKRNLEHFTFPSEMYTTEVRVYRDLLPGTGIASPRIFAIETRASDSEFTILMEDLNARPDVRIGFVLDATTPDEVESLLRTLAKLHASFWGAAVVDRRAPFAKTPREDASMQFWAKIGPSIVRNHLASGHRAGLIDSAHFDVSSLWRAFDRLREADSDAPHTFLHGDVHAGNVYYVRGTDGGLLDWQLALRGSWALDVSYLLTSALTPELRRANERDLLRFYLEQLRAAGAKAPDENEAWLRYRQNALYGVMMWLITPAGVHSDAAQIEYLRRCLTAAEDLETLASLR